MSSGHDPHAPRELCLDLPATHRYARVGRRVARAFARLEGVGGDGLEELSLVVSELLSNCVDHGGGGGAMDAEHLETDVRMRLELAVRDGSWTIAVEDEGGGDPAELARLLEDSAEVALEDERGRGFLLMQHMVDSLAFEPGPHGKGVRIVVEKRHGGGDDAART